MGTAPTNPGGERALRLRKQPQMRKSLTAPQDMNDAWNIKLQTIRTLLNRSDPLMQSLKVKSDSLEPSTGNRDNMSITISHRQTSNAPGTTSDILQRVPFSVRESTFRWTKRSPKDLHGEAGIGAIVGVIQLCQSLRRASPNLTLLLIRAEPQKGLHGRPNVVDHIKISNSRAQTSPVVNVRDREDVWVRSLQLAKHWCQDDSHAKRSKRVTLKQSWAMHYRLRVDTLAICDPPCLLIPSRPERLEDGTRDAECFEETKTNHIVDRIKSFLVIQTHSERVSGGISLVLQSSQHHFGANAWQPPNLSLMQQPNQARADLGEPVLGPGPVDERSNGNRPHLSHMGNTSFVCRNLR